MITNAYCRLRDYNKAALLWSWTQIKAILPSLTFQVVLVMKVDWNNEYKKQRVTLLTNERAASSMLMFSFAEVSNQPAKPFSLQYSSILDGEFTMPSFCWSHWNKKGISLYGSDFFEHLLVKLLYYLMNPNPSRQKIINSWLKA